MPTPSESPPFEPDDGVAVLTRLVQALLGGAVVHGDSGRLELDPGAALERLRPPGAAEGVLLGADQSNAVFRIERLLVKCYCRVEPGEHPDVELNCVLGSTGSAPVPAYAGAIRYRRDDGDVIALALLQEHVDGTVDGWQWATDLAEDALAGASATTVMRRLGEVTAEMHLALRAVTAPRPATRQERQQLRRSAEAQLGAALASVDGLVEAELVEVAPRIRHDVDAFTAAPLELQRVHGDLHVGQVLMAGDDLLVIDFEGEPSRTLADRRRPGSTLRDLAGLLRSLDHVAAVVLDRRRSASDGDRGVAARSLDAWLADCRTAVLAAYRSTFAAADTELVLDARVLRAFEADRACYEFTYAVAYLPRWLHAPLAGLRSMYRGGLLGKGAS